MGKKPDLLEKMTSDFLEFDAKIINYLIVANGAGLAAVLATLKDYSTTPIMHGIGKLVVLFGTGLIAAGIAFGGLQGLSIEMRYLLHREEITSRRAKILHWIENTAIIVSAGCFLYCIFVIMGALAHL